VEGLYTLLYAYPQHRRAFCWGVSTLLRVASAFQQGPIGVLASVSADLRLAWIAVRSFVAERALATAGLFTRALETLSYGVQYRYLFP
jgi:hypothetical protein